jgi:hypothetical protein
MQDRLGNTDALPHTLTERAELLPFMPLEVEDAQDIADTLIRAEQTRQLSEEPKILHQSGTVRELHILWQVPDRSSHSHGIGLHTLPTNLRSAPRWLTQSREQIDGGCLACAIVTEETKNLAGRDFEAQRIERQLGSIRLRQVVSREYCFRHTADHI